MIKRNPYEELIEELVYNFNPLKLEQLKTALLKCFDELDDKTVNYIISSYQERGYILVSADGWVLTKGKYLELTKDSRYQGVDFNKIERRIGDIYSYIQNDEKHLKIVNALWVMIDMLPDSLDYVTSSKPWQITFISKKTHILYQVIVINEDEEDIRIEMLKAMPCDYYDDVKPTIRRIAIMENPKHEFKIPHNMGFTHILRMDENVKTHYVTVKNRLKEKEQIW